MTAHTVHHGFSFSSVSGALHLPRWPERAAAATRVSTRPAEHSLGWMERLALWAERQPVHHHLGSYMLRR